MNDTPAVVNIDAEALKEQGNVAFRKGDFDVALPLYSLAIDMDPQNAKYLVNRSLCYASLGQWNESLDDAKKAVTLEAKFQKAHYRVVKALFELRRFKEARLAILSGLKECGESKEMKQLEEELMTRTGIPLRPKSTDFEIIGELGDGNFSKVFKAQHKPTGKVYAIKVHSISLYCLHIVPLRSHACACVSVADCVPSIPLRAIVDDRENGGGPHEETPRQHQQRDPHGEAGKTWQHSSSSNTAYHIMVSY